VFVMNPQPHFFPIAKRLFLLLAVGALATFVAKSLYTVSATQATDPSNQRKVKTRNFKDMPVSLVEVRNLQSDTWYEDLEIELKNVSNKRIYFLTAYLTLVDEKSGSGESGVHLSWGNADNLDDQKMAISDSEYVEPGRNLVLTIPKMYLKGLRAKQRLRPHVTRNLRLWFEKTYFGDGTGFESEGRWQDFRNNSPPKDKRHHPRNKGLSASALTSTPDVICGGGNCFRWVVPNNSAPSSCAGCLTINATSSDSAPCMALGQQRFDCDGDGLDECYNDVIDQAASLEQACSGASPTPTPTPTPSPTPEPCPWNCSGGTPRDYCTYPNPPGIDHGGCPTFYHPEGNCCLPDPCPAPTPAPPACSGVLVPPSPPGCQWQCLTPPVYASEVTETRCSSTYLVTDHYLCVNGDCYYWYSDYQYMWSTCMLFQ
jgi:hypothetical protein